MREAYQFGTVEIRPVERRVVIGGRPATLGSRAFDVLLALVEPPMWFGEISVFISPRFVITVRQGAASDLHGARLRIERGLDGGTVVSVHLALAASRASIGASSPVIPISRLTTSSARMRRLSAAGVSSATISPWSMIAMRSQSWSASSM